VLPQNLSLKCETVESVTIERALRERLHLELSSNLRMRHVSVEGLSLWLTSFESIMLFREG
jgi:hypothetical protein